MGDRNLTEPGRSMEQLLTRLQSGQQRTQNRQRWPGAIQRTAVDGGSTTMTGSAVATLAAIDLDAGTWAVFGRAGVDISSTPAAPVFTGTEEFVVSMNVLQRDTTLVMEQLDVDSWSPAVTEVAWTGGHYAASVVLFGSLTYEIETTVTLSVAAVDDASAAHLIPWRGGKLMALPF